MKMKLFVLGITIGAIGLVQPLGAVDTTHNVAIAATVTVTAKLSVSAATLTFPNSDPDTVPSIAATEGAVNITASAKTSTGSAVTLTLLADGDLTNGTDSIAISNMTWTAGGADFAAGTMSRTTAQSVASWTSSGRRTGTQSFALANSWSYPTGSYSATATYTLTAP
ncbi:MAG: hypothetical protein NTV05_17895 [Acidobacteria bacterium]|nr:hypothetical protein [Acidobacteriota bacterium]